MYVSTYIRTYIYIYICILPLRLEALGLRRQAVLLDEAADPLVVLRVEPVIIKIIIIIIIAVSLLSLLNIIKHRYLIIAVSLLNNIKHRHHYCYAGGLSTIVLKII